MRILRTLFAIAALSSLSGCYLHGVALDTDMNPDTGCPVPLNDANTEFFGEGYELFALVGVFKTDEVSDNVPIGDPNDPNVPPYFTFGTAVFPCNDDLEQIEFQGEAPFWPVGLNNGVGGSDVVEFHVPRRYMNGAEQVRAHFLSSSIFDLSPEILSQGLELFESGQLSEYFPHNSDVAPGNQAGVIINMVPQGTPAPAMSYVVLSLLAIGLLSVAHFRLTGPLRNLTAALLVSAVIGTAYAATIVVDGQVADWAGIDPLIVDDNNDSSLDDPAEDMGSVFATSDANNLYIRMDIADVEAGAYGGLP